jgi:hypothetical protein
VLFLIRLVFSSSRDLAVVCGAWSYVGVIGPLPFLFSNSEFSQWEKLRGGDDGIEGYKRRHPTPLAPIRLTQRGYSSCGVRNLPLVLVTLSGSGS